MWGHRECGDTGNVGTQGMWVHRKFGDSGNVRTQGMWGHRECGDTENVGTQGIEHVTFSMTSVYKGDMIIFVLYKADPNFSVF